MARNDEARGKKHVGPAYPARYARLGRIGRGAVLRRGLLVIGIIALFAVILLVMLPG